MISYEDRVIANDLISLHGHLVDEGKLDELTNIFSQDVIYDLQDFNFGCLNGLDSLINSALALGKLNPIGHHVTNIFLTEGEDPDTIFAKSKGIGIMSDGTCGSVTYEDTFKRKNGKWKIIYRKVINRRVPLGGNF